MKSAKCFILDHKPEQIGKLIEMLKPYLGSLEITTSGNNYDEAKSILSNDKFAISFLNICPGDNYWNQLCEEIPAENFGILVFMSKKKSNEIPISRFNKKNTNIYHLEDYTPKTIKNIAEHYASQNFIFKEEKPFKRITVTEKGTIYFLDPLHIVLIQTVGEAGIYITYTYVENELTDSVKKTSIVRESLKNLEKVLPHTFFRISRNCLLNISFIESICDCSIRLKVKDGTQKISMPTSNTHKNNLIKLVSLSR